MRDGETTSRFFALFIRHRGGWGDLRESRERHHATALRFTLFKNRTFWALWLPDDSPHPVVARAAK